MPFVQEIGDDHFQLWIGITSSQKSQAEGSGQHKIFYSATGRTKTLVNPFWGKLGCAA
jgi:hypothetical protein